jgi:hypothetical protein
MHVVRNPLEAKKAVGALVTEEMSSEKVGMTGSSSACLSQRWYMSLL